MRIDILTLFPEMLGPALFVFLLIFLLTRLTLLFTLAASRDRAIWIPASAA